eukprot:CAMPEP_0185293140 /NCGR_PEP_ID=MMETSP1363-20130426/6617_1 /TAXON_ID=38817 /ORGANISM="Gephyrocapsa oceanica, Strain RCC1303" /LENGTH=41 /DNA_ID= /DNA_START= /DNA_END= /DNA_ORIENTATION=
MTTRPGNEAGAHRATLTLRARAAPFSFLWGRSLRAGQRRGS